MNKITAEHLARRACVYIRQSTPDQVQNNLESQRRQYALAERARVLGWDDVEVIDEDLGKSGSGTPRVGFERLLSGLCDGQVGAVLSIEASRLARNGRDWHTLLEFCSVVGALLIDAEGIYDPRHINDRLLLGMKGTISEMELASFRQRAQAALEQKAQRGELFHRRLHWSSVNSRNLRVHASCISGSAISKSSYRRFVAYKANVRLSGRHRVIMPC
jgi:DNA invertase Pin-like site-specific DNA recombinase